MPASSPATIQLDGTHHVLTPEYVEFNFVLAGLMSRFLALFIDTVISIGLFLLLALALTIFTIVGASAGAAVAGSGAGETVSGLGVSAAFVTWFVIDWGYMVLLEVVWNGQTIGKRAMGLRVIQDSGVRVGVQQALLRNLVRPVDKFPFYLVGAAFTLVTGTQQRLGDLLAGTIVVRERKLKIPSALEHPEGDTSLLADHDFRARVARLSPEEEAVLYSAALRREELGMEARLTLFAALAERLEDDRGFAKPPHLSDEKLVLLVTATLAAKNAQKKKKAPPKRFLQK